MIGRQLSHFYIVGRLGSGGMGEVYEAQDMRLPRSVALKVLRPTLTSNQTAIKRFRREAWLASSLNHPHICTVLDVGEADGLSFIAMELLQGVSLKQRLRESPLPEAQLLDAAIDITRALISAHDAGIVHRDITPGNIFLTNSGATKLLDFGLAKAAAISDTDESEASESVTTAGAVAGTLQHLSPEQLRSEPVDRRTDLFALGTVLYQAATGVRPFDAATRGEIIDRILGEDPVPLRRLAPEWPIEFERMVARLMAKSPDRRYQRASDLLRDLEFIKQRQAEPSPPVRRTNAVGTFAVAVLPFRILGDEDAGLRGFRDGLPEDLTWWLRNLPGLRVAPWTSVESLRGSSVRELGQKLDVKAVIEGSVQRSGDQLRVTVTFIDTRTEQPLRPPLRIDAAANDLFAAQDLAARQIVSGVKSAVAHAQILLGTRNLDAYQEYQHGLKHTRDMFGGSWRQAIDCATRAIERDPGFAPAHVMLADAYCFLGLLSLLTPNLAFDRARTSARQALELDPELASAHAAEALVRFGKDWDWDGAEASFRRALDLDGDLAIVRIYYSWLLGLLGREAAAFAEVGRAIEIAPSRMVLTGGALTYFMANRYDEAIAYCNQSLARGDDYIFASYLRGQCHHMRGDYAAAHADLERAVTLGQREPFFLGLLGKSYGEAGQRDRARAIIDELDQLSTRKYVAPHCYVYVLYGLGEPERALAYQQQAYRDGAAPLNYLTPFIKELFSLDPLHRDRLRQMRLNV